MIPQRQAIVSRFERGGRKWRTLECGHQQFECSGGKAGYATHAVCKSCPPDSPRPVKLPAATVGATCTAIIVPLREQRMRLCGQSAKVVNARDQPRCARCARKAAKP